MHNTRYLNDNEITTVNSIPTLLLLHHRLRWYHCHGIGLEVTYDSRCKRCMWSSNCQTVWWNNQSSIYIGRANVCPRRTTVANTCPTYFTGCSIFRPGLGTFLSRVSARRACHLNQPFKALHQQATIAHKHKLTIYQYCRENKQW